MIIIDDLYYFISTAMKIFFIDFSGINNENYSVFNNHTDFGIILDWKFTNYKKMEIYLFLYIDNLYS